MRLRPRSSWPTSVLPVIERADEPERRARRSGATTPAWCACVDGVGQQRRRPGPGTAALSERTTTRLKLAVAERGREPDEGDDRLHEHERRRVRERAGVAEAVGDAQAHERVARGAAGGRTPRRARRASSPVSSHVSGTGVAVLTAASAGTQTVIAPGADLDPQPPGLLAVAAVELVRDRLREADVELAAARGLDERRRSARSRRRCGRASATTASGPSR